MCSLAVATKVNVNDDGTAKTVAKLNVNKISSGHYYCLAICCWCCRATTGTKLSLFSSISTCGSLALKKSENFPLELKKERKIKSKLEINIKKLTKNKTKHDILLSTAGKLRIEEAAAKW